MAGTANGISLAAARGNFLTWCLTGQQAVSGLCHPLFIGQGVDPLPAETKGNTAYDVYSLQQAIDLFGQGSPLALMAEQHFACCPELPLSMIAVANQSGAVAAQNTITVTGPATASGMLSFTVMDIPIQVAVQTGDTADAIATGIKAAFDARPNLPYTTAVATGTVTLTSKVKGPAGDWFSPVVDSVPAGVGLDMEQTVDGTGVIDILPVANAFACCYDCIGLGFEDEAAVQQVIDWVEEKWECGTQGQFCGGHVFHSKTGYAADIAAYGKTRNNATESVIPVPLTDTELVDGVSYKYPGYQMAAAMTSRFCCSACDDPSRPVQYDNGVLCALYDSRLCSGVWTSAEKRAFFDAGITIWDVAAATGVRDTSLVIEEPLTTYKYNANGQPDIAWRRVESRYTAAKFTRDLGAWYRTFWSSTSLVNDGTRIPRGKRAVSPSIMRASITAWIVETQEGWTAENTAAIQNMVHVYRENTPGSCDPDRLSVSISLDLVNQLARIATAIDIAPEFSCRATPAALAA